MLETIFYHIDNFCKQYENQFGHNLLTDGLNKRRRKFSLSSSEIMTIMVFYHHSGYKSFKAYYTKHVIKYMQKDFNKLVSYNRFLELKQKVLPALFLYLHLKGLGECTGKSIIDSFSLPVSHNKRISSHKTFKGIAKTYPETHWALQKFNLKDTNVIALATYKNHEFAVYLNPSDKRGYRSIVRLMNDNMSTTVNREYTSQEKIGLALITQLITDAYKKIVPVVQTAEAGNNAQIFDPQTGVTYIGTSNEPQMLHSHIIARGNPEFCYIQGVKLDGPVPGKIFDMRGQTPNEAGNNKKIAWKTDEVEKTALQLKAEIDKVKNPYIELGLQIYN